MSVTNSAELFVELFTEAQAEALNERENLLLDLRYGIGSGEPHTLEEVGQALGVSRERARQLQWRALRKIVAKGSRQLKNGNLNSPCAQLQLYVKEFVRPGEEGEVERIFEFCRTELGFMPLGYQMLELVFYLLRYSGNKAKDYGKKIWELDRAQRREAQQQKASAHQFEELTKSIIWPKQVQIVEMNRLELRRSREINPESIGGWGGFKSSKLKREVQFESSLEQGFYEKLEGWPEVITYQEQPFRVGYELDGERRSYYPDVFFVLKDGRGVVAEVVPRYQMALRLNLVKWGALRRFCEERGWGVLVTDGKNSIQQMQRYPIRAEVEQELVAAVGKRQEGLNWEQYQIYRDKFEIKWPELVAIILKNRLIWRLQPFRLALDRSEAKGLNQAN